MPGVIPAVVTFLGSGTFIANAVKFIGANLLLSKASQLLAGKQPNLSGAARARLVTVRGTIEPRMIVYGQARVGGVLVFARTSGTNNEFLHYVIALAGHEVESITDIWFDNEVILSANINGSGDVTGGRFNGKTSIRKHLGTSTQTVDTVLDAAFDNAIWDTNHRGLDVAYIAIRLERDDTIFGNGPPTNFTALLKGRKIYDPRLDSTNGGSGTQRYTDSTTWTWSENPALCLRDYLTAGFGLEVPHTKIDDTLIAAAANTCEETVSLPASGTQDRYTCDGALSTGVTIINNIENLLTSMHGRLTYSGGKYQLFVGEYPTASFTLDESDLRDNTQLQVITQTPSRERWNAVRGTYIDPARNYQAVEFGPQTDNAFETEDGGFRLWRDILLPFTNTDTMSQRIAIQILKQSRNHTVLSFPANIRGFDVELWATGSVTLAALGYSAKTFRCIDWSESPDGGVDLVLREELSANWNDPATGDYGAESDAVDPGNIEDVVPAPTSLITTDVIDAIHIAWDLPSDPNIYDRAQLFEYDTDDRESVANPVYEGRNAAHSRPFSGAQTKYYRVRYINAVGTPGALYPLIIGNLLTRTEALNHADWTKVRATITADAIANPIDAVVDADELVEDSTASATHFVHQDLTKAATAIQYVFSAYLKANVKNHIALRVEDGAGNYGEGVFHLADGTLHGSGIGGTGFTLDSTSITSEGSGWYRCTIVVTTNSATTARFAAYLHDGTSVTYSGGGSSSVYVTNLQVKEQSVVEAYIANVLSLSDPAVAGSSQDGSPALSASVSPTVLTTTGGNVLLTSGVATAVGSGGDGGPYTYTWQKVSGITLTITSGSAAGTTFSHTGTDQFVEGIYRCKVDDATTTVFTPNVRIRFTHGTPP